MLGKTSTAFDSFAILVAAGEPANSVENPTVKGDQSDEQQIGKRDTREFDREHETTGILIESWRQQSDHTGRENKRDREQDDLA